MQYCPKCRVRIRGHKERCPLCLGELTDTDGTADSGADDPFVRLPRPQVSSLFLIRLVSFVCILLMISFGTVYLVTGFIQGWALIVLTGILVGWVDFLVAVYYRNDIIRMQTVQTYIIMLLCILIDRMTGFLGWSLAWVTPGLFIFLILLTFLLADMQDMELQDYILYPVVDAAASLLQLIPIATGANRQSTPAVISMALMLVLASGIIIFRGRMLCRAAGKYLHL